MKIPTKYSLVAACAVLFSGCEIFESQTPETITFSVNGDAGDVVTVIYAKNFIAAPTETGTTQVEVFEADTIVHTLPVDTIIDVRLERQLFLRVQPTGVNDTIPVSVRVDVNERSIFDGSGDIFSEDPWHFLYRFNAPPTQTIEVVI
jgi:hypothetical protein